MNRQLGSGKRKNRCRVLMGILRERRVFLYSSRLTPERMLRIHQRLNEMRLDEMQPRPRDQRFIYNQNGTISIWEN